MSDCRQSSIDRSWRIGDLAGGRGQDFLRLSAGQEDGLSVDVRSAAGPAAVPTTAHSTQFAKPRPGKRALCETMRVRLHSRAMASSSYNLMRAESARTLAGKAAQAEDRWRLLRIAHQYEAIATIEALRIPIKVCRRIEAALV